MSQWSVSFTNRGENHDDPEIHEGSYALDHTSELGSKIANIHDSHNGNAAFVKEHPDYPHERKAVTRKYGQPQKTLHVTTPEGHKLEDNEVESLMSGGDSDKIRSGAEERVKRGKQQKFENDTDKMMRDIDTEDVPSPIHPDIQKKYQFYGGGSVSPVDESGKSDGTVTHNVPRGWYRKSGARLPNHEDLNTSAPADRSSDSNRSFGSTDGHFSR